MRFKIVLFALALLCSFAADAKSKKKKRSKKNKNAIAKDSTAYFICSKKYFYKNETLVEVATSQEQKIILAIETKNNEQCKLIGGTKLLQLSKEGWSCTGRETQDYFSCLTERASKLTEYDGVKLTYLKYKNLSKNIGIVGYFGESAYENCVADRDEMKEGGVTDATCYKNQ